MNDDLTPIKLATLIVDHIKDRLDSLEIYLMDIPPDDLNKYGKSMAIGGGVAELKILMEKLMELKPYL